MIIDRLYQEAVKKGPICVGLDTRLEYLPEYIKQANLKLEEKIFEFNRKIIDATLDDVACYKLQIACYEALGLAGLIAYAKTLKYIRKNGKIVIADIKRGDISSTAELYAEAHFSGDFEADFITVNPYLGRDAIKPYFKYLNRGEKGLFVLMRTSNPGSEDFQDLIVEDEPLYLHVARKIKEWGQEFKGEAGYSLIGGVVGLTYPQEFMEIKNNTADTFYLIPGYGAQGGTGQDLARILQDEICAVVNSSRGIITAHQGVDESENFAQVSREQVLKMKEDILQWLK